MAMLDDIKTVMRISNTAFDTELNALIAAVRADLVLTGVLTTKAQDDTDPLIKRAVSIYVKAHFGWDNPDSEKLLHSYNMLKTHLALSKEYTVVS
jgi:uncharacterized phage protein (predicted DNA packaging)